jgi:AAA family ATP:ADP antiporter
MLDHKKIKTIILGICFFGIIGAYTLLRELKDAIFSLIVGQALLPDVKIISFVVMVPMVFFYTWLSSRISRHYLLSFYALFYSMGSFVIAYFLGHSQIGLYNTVASSSRIFGWAVYLFFEGLSPFLVSVNWSFLNSISRPDDIKSTYIIMTAMGKLGTTIFACFAWLLMTKSLPFFLYNNDIDLYILLLRFSATVLLLIPLLLFILIKALPSKDLQGYVDINEKKDVASHKTKEYNFGIKTIFQNSYVLSIVGMVFFWEIINVIFNNLRLTIAYSNMTEIASFSSFLFKSTAIMGFVSLFFVLIGTNSIVNYLGERKGLLLIPVLTGVITVLFLVYKTQVAVLIAWTLIRAINLSLTTPLRESLYIPTSKDFDLN